MIYFDNGATTFPKPPAVISAMNQTMRLYGANPGRSGHKMSFRASELIYDCRVNAAKFFGAEKPENVIFTSNCTAALNTVIKGTLKSGDHAVISALEHNAVVRPLEFLKKSGISYSVADFSYDGDELINNFREALQPNTRLVISTQASNVFGVRLPVERLGAMCRLYEIPFCVDAAQTAGAVPVSLAESPIDFLCTAGHKGLYGPMGTGLLIINTDKTPESLIQGGTGSLSLSREQPGILPDKYESGTPNLPGIAGLNEGIRFVQAKNPKMIMKSEIRLAQRLYDSLKKINGVELYAPRPEENGSVAVVSFNIVGKDSEDVAMLLSERYNIAVRAGLHCAPLAHQSFGTIESGTVRAVISVYNKPAQTDYLADSVRRIAANQKNEKIVKKE